MKTFKIKLTKLGSVENPYVEPEKQYVKPEEEKILVTRELPKEGLEFFASYHNYPRFFKTSTVKKIIETKSEGFDPEIMIFETWNSRYKLQVLELKEQKDE
jgi:hypothetical protein